MAVLLLLIIGTIVFWNDVSSAFNKRESIVENEPKKENKNKKNKKDKDDEKKKGDKDEANNVYFLNRSSIVWEYFQSANNDAYLQKIVSFNNSP